MKMAEAVRAYGKKQGWKSPVLVNLYLCAAGLAIGYCIPRVRKHSAFFAAVLVFFAANLPAVTKIVRRAGSRGHRE